MTPQLQVLRAVRERLSDPRRWVKGMWQGHRDANGAWGSVFLPANCWCVDRAISVEVEALYARSEPTETWTELRSKVAEAVHDVIARRGGGTWANISPWNDNQNTSHADVLSVLDEAIREAT